MVKNLPFSISGVIIGIILFQSSAIAPAINKLINVNDASDFLRFIWPIFFLIIAALSLKSAIIIFTKNKAQKKGKFYAISSFILMMFCFFITPTINDAKDLNNDELWSILHLLTVVLTFITLILNILNIYHWKFYEK